MEMLEEKSDGMLRNMAIWPGEKRSSLRLQFVSRSISSARARLAVEGELNRLSLRSDAYPGEWGNVAPKS
jgi:hypothetical protein